MMFSALFADSAQNYVGMAAVIAVFIFVSVLLFFIKRYQRCPSNKIMVIYGRSQGNKTAQCIHGGAKFIIPVLQDYAFLSLEPMQIEIPLRGALSMENIRVNVPSVFSIAIGTTPELMQNAAIRLLGLRKDAIAKQAEDIIFGQLRQVIASMKIEEINRDREAFLMNIQTSLEPELRKIGLVLINVNVTDITDESGYIEAIGQKAASEAIQKARGDVADNERMGEIRVAEAEQQKEIQVANAQKLKMIGTREAERDMRVKTADADASAIDGENKAKAFIANSGAELKVREAEAFQLGETRKRQAEALVLEAEHKAQTQAALAEAQRVEAERRAELEAPAKAEKAKMIVEAEAVAEQKRIEAEGEAKAIYAKLEAEARGQYEILAKKGEGLREIIKACGGAKEAFQMMMLDHFDELVSASGKAISGIKFDKVVVWDGAGENGKTATANWLHQMSKTLPPMLEVMKEIGGVEFPDILSRFNAGSASQIPQSGQEPETVLADTDSGESGSADDAAKEQA